MRNPLVILSLTVLLLGFVAVAEAGWQEGVQAFKSGNFNQAVQEFESVVDAQPEFAGGHFMLGQAYMRLKKNSDALTHLLKAYELEPSKVSHQFLLAQAYLSNRRYGESLQVLKKINPSSLPKQQQDAYQQMLAVALDKSGRSDEALSALRQVARNNPDSDAAWFAYGTAALKADELDQAVDALERSVRLDGQDSQKKELLAKALIQKARRTRDSSQKKGVYARGVSVAKGLVSSSPSHANLLLLGELQLGAGQYDDAEATFRQAVGKNGNDYYGQYYLSQARTAQKEWSAAQESARRALDLARTEQDKKRVWTQIGFINEKTKNYEEAKIAYSNAGDQEGLRRVEENQRIAEENKEVEEHNRQIEELRKEEEALQEALEDLQGGGKPPLR